MSGKLARLVYFTMSSGIWLALASCGAAPTAPTPTVAAPGISPTFPTTVATPSPTASPAAQSITITSDRAMYTPNDVIQVTVMNHANVMVVAVPGHASCTILTLEMFINGQWQPSAAAPCPTQPAQAVVQLRPNVAYHGAIRGLELPYHLRPFAIGEYRLTIAYWQNITGAIPSPHDSKSIVSPSFTIH